MVKETGPGAIASMTGYAAREGGDGAGAGWSWELRSVNARGLEIRLRLPEGLGALEAPLRARLGQVVQRGNVTLSLRLSRGEGEGEARLDAAAVEVAIGRLQQLRHAAEGHFVDLAPPTAAEIIALMPPQSGSSALPGAETLLADAEPLLASFDAMRRAEGRALARLLVDQIARIETLIEAATEAAAARAPRQAERLHEALATLRGVAETMDETRVAQELALLATKTDVTEEIDRLGAHVEAAVALLEAGGPVGRKLDFLMQEFNREANTLCSKAQDARLTAIGLDLKLAIDQTREQVQNVE